MLFHYIAGRVLRPIPTLQGATTRYFPVIPVWLTHAGATYAMDALVDSAASDVVFPLRAAQRLGIDLTHASVGESRQAGGTWLRYRYAPVQLRLSDGRESCVWQAVVGFLDAPMPWALLGHAGCLEFFDVSLFGARREVEIIPNSAFAGSGTVH